jgi:hypothetical protein
MRTPDQRNAYSPPFVAGCGRCQGDPFNIEPTGELCIAHAREVMAAQGQSWQPRRLADRGFDTDVDPYAARFRALSGMRIGA